MNRLVSISIFLIAVIVASTPADAGRFLRGAPITASRNLGTELSAGDLCSEQALMNIMKCANEPWELGDNSGALTPDQLTATGYPKSGAAWQTSGKKAVTIVNAYSQYTATGNGHMVMDAIGANSIQVGFDGNGGVTTVSCVGTASTSGGFVGCDNTACSSFTGSIAPGSPAILTVTSAPTGSGCTLGPGVPISGAGITISTFGTKTIVTSAGTTCGSNTCYTVNQSQTVASETMNLGWHLEWAVTTPFGGTLQDQYSIQVISTSSGNNLDQMAIIYKADEPAYWASATSCGNGQACILGTLWKERVKTQAGISRLRDLDLLGGNSNFCSAYETRKPIPYFTYELDELRNAASGNTTYVAGGHTYTVPRFGQYVNAAGTGASGGTVSYNAGTDVYSITLGSGGPVDKQSIIFTPPATGTTSSKINLNGTGALPGPQGTLANPFIAAFTSGQTALLVYDAALGGWLGNPAGTFGCDMPPEVHMELAAEIGAVPWHVAPYLAMDTMTDWPTQWATYQKAHYTSKPIIEISNEPFNTTVPNAVYMSAKSSIWIAADPTHWQNGTFHSGATGNNLAEVCKMGSTVGQDLTAVLGSGNFDMFIPMQTASNIGFFPAFNDAINCVEYANQTIAIQTGYTNVPAWTYATKVSINNYNNTGAYQTPSELAFAYCYTFYSSSAGCQANFASANAVMTAYLDTALASTCGSASNPCSTFTPVGLAPFYAIFKNFVLTCGTGTLPRPSGCNMDTAVTEGMYEGGYNQAAISGDFVWGFGTATSQGATTIFLAPDGGCAGGQNVAITGFSGGWSGATPGNYIVQASGTDGAHCAVNLNSTGFSAMASTTATANWGRGGSISVASCPSVTGNFSVYDQTQGIVIGVATGCSGGVISSFTGTNWGGLNPQGFSHAGGNSGDVIVFAPSLTFTGSQFYLNWLYAKSYTSPELKTITTAMYNAVINNGGSAPSQFHMANGLGYVNTGGGFPWYNYGSDITGFYPVSQCSACNVTGSTMTLGGTLQGIFETGQVLWGGQLIGIPGGASATNTTVISCTPVGGATLPCGANVGDQLGLSQAQPTPLTGVNIVGKIPPPTNLLGNSTTSPIPAFDAVCDWVGNGSQCNGWLLERDIDPASNDNDPMWLEKAA
jgi:hypothetical protein